MDAQIYLVRTTDSWVEFATSSRISSYEKSDDWNGGKARSDTISGCQVAQSRTGTALIKMFFRSAKYSV